MQAVAVLRPANAYEACLAVEVIAADAYAMDCLRLAGQHCSDLAATLRCRAQATAMMRQVHSTRLMLEREQATRMKAEVARPEPAPQSAPPRDPVAEAENFAITHTDEAARIRRNGQQGQPITTGLDPALVLPDPAVIAALVSGASSVLCELDAIACVLAEAARGNRTAPGDAVP